MIGVWNGTYWFSCNVSETLKNRKTNFELVIEDFTKTKISGTVSDDLETGGTRGIGTFSGSVKGNKIKFTKRMPVKTWVLPDGTRIEENKPHNPIYYTGTINPETGLIKGTWKIKMGIYFAKGQLVFHPGTKGAWEIKNSTSTNKKY